MPVLTRAATAALLVSATTAGSLQADVWVFEPSVTLGQRFDDNYYLDTVDGSSLSATRGIGQLILSRESAAASFRGLARVDGLLTASDENRNDGLDSNQLVGFDAKLKTARTRYGIGFGFKQDTPSRDIVSDLVDESAVPTDTGLTVSQSNNVNRQEITLKPYFEYDVSRRLAFSSRITATDVKHDLPDPQDAIYRQYIDSFPRNEDGSLIGTPLAFDEVTLADVGDRFTATGELDDFREARADFEFKYKLSRITTVSASVGLSRYVGQVEPDPFAVIPFEDLEEDPKEREIRRKPRRDSISETRSLSLGYERYLTPVLQFKAVAGVYDNSSDLSDTLRAEDRPGEEIPQERLDALVSESNGWVGGLGFSYDAGATQYEAIFKVDVEPSSSGTQVETHELTGLANRVINPRLRVSLRGRAYEPDRLAANVTDRFSRRFISFEPRVDWQYSRNWAVSASYRYRRQKARVDLVSAESNAFLFSITYTPPSEVRDLANSL